MTINIAIESPVSDSSRALIDGSEAALRAVFSEDECFTFSPEELDNADTDFLVARVEGQAVGCVALVDVGSYGEIKRMFVDPAARGQGIAQALMAALETRARERGLTDIKLESGPPLVAALALYRSLGYAECGPFGGYEAIEASVFMQKSLTA